MSEKVGFELVSPESLMLHTDCEMVVVPGAEGDFGVLVGHAPLISEVRPGFIEVHDEGVIINRLLISGGIAEVVENKLTVLAEEAVSLSDLKAGDIEERITVAETLLKDAADDSARNKLEDMISLLNQIRDTIH